MISAGAVQYQHGREKAEYLTDSILCLIGGDTALHTMIARRVREALKAEADGAPGKRIDVEHAALLYRDEYTLQRTQWVEQEVLHPHDLTMQNLRKEHRTLRRNFVDERNAEIMSMTRFYDEEFSAIIAGVQGEEGHEKTHIYALRGARLTCEDRAGFAAIGSGATHASAMLETRGHVPDAAVEDALFDLLIAKRAAEVAPGVGTQTDMFVVGPRLDNASPIRTDIQREIEAAVEERLTKIQQVEQQSRQDVRKRFEVLFPVAQIVAALSPAGVSVRAHDVTVTQGPPPNASPLPRQEA